MHLAKINNEPDEFLRIFPRPPRGKGRLEIERVCVSGQEAGFCRGCRDLFEYLEAVFRGFRRIFLFLDKFGEGGFN